MEYEILKRPGISICYLETELTRSHAQNFHIIRRHWKAFNALLRINKVRLGPDWEKYAITQKRKGDYYYQCAFPAKTHVSPFEFSRIPAGSYIRFVHKGPMNAIRGTINTIYKDIIPDSGLKIDVNRSMIHYERYDANFNWNKQDSNLDLYVPLMNAASIHDGPQ